MAYNKQNFKGGNKLYAAQLNAMDEQISRNEANIAEKIGASELNNAVEVALTQAKESGEFDGAQGIPGEKGDKGDTGAQGPQGEKGDKGDIGATGENGADGKDGASVTVTNVTTSNADGGSNVVTFSDGKTLTVKNGSKGGTGEKGEKGDKGDIGATGTKGDKGDKGDPGSDAAVTADNIRSALGYTPANAEAVDGKVAKNQGAVNAGKILIVGSDGILTLADMPEVGVIGDVVGTLDESNNLLLSGNIAEGTYPLKWLMDDGSYTDAGTLTVVLTPEEPEPEAVINWIPNSTNADGTPYVGTNGEKGYKTGYRLSSSGGTESAQAGYEVTGFIPVKWGDTIYLKGIVTGTDGKNNICFYKSDKTHINGAYTGSVFTETSGDVKYRTLAKGILDDLTTNASNIAFMRLSSSEITDNSIITINQPIE